MYLSPTDEIQTISPISSKMCNEFTNEEELLKFWTKDLVKPICQYKEPILDEQAVNIVKVACDTFKQDVHVFITAIEIFEEYVRRKYKYQQTNYDEILILATTIFISSKYTGELIDLKVKYIAKFLKRITNIEYAFKVIIAAEIDILRTLDGSLPLRTVADDVNTVIELHIQETQTKINLRPLCFDILQMMYICRKKWIAELTAIYSQNNESFLVLKFLMSSQLYVPVVVLIVSLYLTKYKLKVDISSLMNDITVFTKIHSDHLNILAGIVINIIQSKA